MPDDRLCQCCGQVKPPQNRVTVDLTENLLIYNGQSITVTPRLAELAHILGRRMPGVVTHESIGVQMWGNGDSSPVCMQSGISVAVLQLRRAICPLGLEIASVFGTGYRMQECPDAR